MNKIISRKLATDAIDGIMTQLYHIALSGAAENAADQINFVTILQELVQLRHNDDYKIALEQMSMEGFTEYYTLFFDLVNAMGLESVKDLSDWHVVNTKTLPQAISQTKKTGDVVELLQGFNATELSPLPYDDKIGTVKRILNDWFVLDDKERQIVKLLDSVSSPEERTVLSNALLEGNNSLLKTLLSKIDGEEKLTAFRFFDELLSSAKGPKETVTIPDGRTVGGIFKKDKIKLTSYYASSNIGGIKDKEYLVSPFATVMYTYKKERFPLPAFFFTDQNVLNDFIFENRYAETLDWATLTEKQKDDYYFEFVMHYLPKGFLEQLGSPLQIIIGAIIGIFAAGLLAPLKVALIALDIGSMAYEAYQGVLLVIEATERKKDAASIRELKESAHLMATGVSKLTMQVVNAILSFASSRKGGTNTDTTTSGDSISISNKKRPSWRKSEIDGRDNFPGYTEQKSFNGTKEVKYGTKGSVRPDFYKQGFSVDIKNYNIQTVQGRSNLSRNIAKQYYQRLINLPPNTKQTVLIDIRGQNVNENTLELLYNSIMRRTQNGIEIIFKLR
ncbi:MAG TPA: hypothetical protein PLV73_11870 [Treponemataceae bacterium]|nr:hypothetical protein [Treponemataceae bacterium]